MVKRKSRQANEILDAFIGDDEGLRQAVEEETANLQVASLLYEARTRAGLTQQRLAELVGTTQSAISRLESGEYRGHSLSMLVRIAAALGKSVRIRLVPTGNVRWPA